MTALGHLLHIWLLMPFGGVEPSVFTTELRWQRKADAAGCRGVLALDCPPDQRPGAEETQVVQRVVIPYSILGPTQGRPQVIVRGDGRREQQCAGNLPMGG